MVRWWAVNSREMDPVDSCGRGHRGVGHSHRGQSRCLPTIVWRCRVSDAHSEHGTDDDAIAMATLHTPESAFGWPIGQFSMPECPLPGPGNPIPDARTSPAVFVGSPTYITTPNKKIFQTILRASYTTSLFAMDSNNNEPMDQIKMKCPICNGEVHKSRPSDREIKHNVLCQNEYYIHYRDVNGHDVLNKHHEAHVNAPEKRFGL